jgi:hypothetical protein
MGSKKINVGFCKENLTKNMSLWRPKLKWEVDIKIDVNKYDGMVRTGFIWLRISINCGLLRVFFFFFL